MTQDCSQEIQYENSSTDTPLSTQDNKNKYMKKISSGNNAKRPRKQRQPWNAHQNAKYCQFIGENREILQRTQKKYKQKIFNKMSAYILTRASDQCKSHHQKLLARYLTIQKVIQGLGIQKKVSQISQNKEQSDEFGQDSNQMDYFCVEEQPRSWNEEYTQEKEIIEMKEQRGPLSAKRLFDTILEGSTMVEESQYEFC